MAAKKFTGSTFVVEGRGEFPLDMLRHDHAWPYTSRDAAVMRAEGERRQITLMTSSPNSPTVGRWNSFLWAVVEGGD